ncbi:asparaginase [Candidatus Peregrinibacteria bacterium]|nr:asparaginase [Candidatus Peregrinibacteria bacterium]
MIKILHLSTGGTITGCAPEYPQIADLAAFFSDAIHIEKYLCDSLKMTAEYSSVEICNKDSRDINEQDLKNLQNEIEKAYSTTKHFLITHGTYTMPETAIYLMDNLPENILNDVSIILTGAMYPMNLIGSDGLMNLGASVSSLINSDKPLGIKINMHGKNWEPRTIEKDTENLIFKEI